MKSDKLLESYAPKLIKGMIVPSGKQFVYQAQGLGVELPFAMADLILLCDGQNSIFQILAKIHQKQGVVHFKKLIDTLILLFEKGFIENSDEIKPLIEELYQLTRGLDFRSRVFHLISSISPISLGRRVFLKSEIFERVRRNSFFAELDDEELDLVINECEVILFSKGQDVIHHDEKPQDIYYLIEGKCEAQGEGFSGMIQRGSFFGEGALRESAYRSAKVVAKSACKILRIPVSSLKQVTSSPIQLETLKNQIIVSQFFGSSPHFQEVHQDTIERLERAGQLEVVDSEHVVFKDGELTNGIYFLIRGSVRVEVSEEKVVILGQGELFGEISVMAKLPRTARVTTREPCFLFKVSVEAFWEVLLSDLSFGYKIERLCEERLTQDYEFLQKKSRKVG